MFVTRLYLILQISFNRYMVECESKKDYCSYTVALVLIDTWWNVNNDLKPTILIVVLVLIDTWWNVNHASGIMILRVNIRFNRYMVECEYYILYYVN